MTDVYVNKYIFPGEAWSRVIQIVLIYFYFTVFSKV